VALDERRKKGGERDKEKEGGGSSVKTAEVQKFRPSTVILSFSTPPRQEEKRGGKARGRAISLLLPRGVVSSA